MEEISEKKQAIFESALELIKEHGFHGAPMSLMAKKADVATGTIYHYFESKEKLICDLYAYNRTRLVGIVKSELSGSGTYKERFIAMWKKVFEFYTKNPNLLIFFEQYVNSPFNTYKQPQDFEDQPLSTFIIEGTKAGELKEVHPRIMLIHIISSSISIAKLHQFGSLTLSEEDLNKTVEMIWSGIARN